MPPKPHRIFKTPFSSIYPLYVAKVLRKGRTQEEVDAVLCWLTGHDKAGLSRQLDAAVDLEAFLREAPALNPARHKVKGVVCGVRVEDVADPLMREIRRMDRLIDELAKGWPLDRILRC
jgi:hypothetical protein